MDDTRGYESDGEEYSSSFVRCIEPYTMVDILPVRHYCSPGVEGSMASCKSLTICCGVLGKNIRFAKDFEVDLRLSAVVS
jgi:hypothetical protein